MGDFGDFNTIGRMSAVDQVIAYVRHAVATGVYRVGDRLPNEAELAKVIGGGRSSLREGMRILAAYGMVEIRQGEGSFIIDKTAERFFDIMGYMQNSDFQNFLELRRVIEVGAVANVYDKITAEDLDELQKLTDMLEYENGLEACVRADRDFHRKLVSYTGNPLLLQIEKMIYQTRSELLYKIMCYRDIVDGARIDHQKIVNALRARDMDQCLSMVMRHMDDVTENVARLKIEKNPSGAGETADQ